MRKVTIKGLLAHKLRLALTSLAIVLGVTFISGTLVLTDTLHNMFFSLVGNIYQKIDFDVRGVAQFPGNSADAVRNPLAEAVLTTVLRAPGVEAAYGEVVNYAQFLSHTGQPIATGSEPTLGENFDPDPRTSELRIVQGGPPTNSHDVLMDAGTAKKYHFSVGQRARVLFGGPTRAFTITGIVQFGTVDNLAGVTVAAFTLPTAQEVMGEVGQLDHINVVAKPGADKAAVERAIARALPPGAEVVTGQTVVNEQTSSIDQALSFFSTALCWCSPSSRCSSVPLPSSTPFPSRSGSGRGSWPCCASSAPAVARCPARCSGRPPLSACSPRSSVPGSGCSPPLGSRRC
jgi:putative ABC transport system permease protein